MQHYGQVDYQRPESATGFAGQQGAPPPRPPLPPGYGGPHQYPPAAPQAHSQWAVSTPTHTSSPWSQSQQQAGGGYNPVTYGLMPGGQQQSQSSYSHQQLNQLPPPPPPKPHGFAAAVQQQQNTQNWHQSGYNNAAPPHSATLGGSNSSSAPGGRPNSMYGQAAFQQTASVASPSEQQSVYIPPSGAQAYRPSSTNSASGAYVPPPTDAHPWQQAQHTPLQGGNQGFTYANPTVGPGFHSQGYQGLQHPENEIPPPLPPRLGQQQNTRPQQPPSQYGQPGQDQLPQYTQPPQNPSFQTQFPPQQQQQQSQFEQVVRPQQQTYGQPEHQAQFQQHTIQSQYGQTSHEQQVQQHAQYSQPQNQWQSPYPSDSGFGQPNAHISFESQRPIDQQYPQVPDQGIKAPKPLSPTDTSHSNFFQPTPPSQPVSPISNRPSISSASGQQSAHGRPESVSSIALANFHAQRAENKTVSPKPLPLRIPTSPPRDEKSKFSVLGVGGPSDWERFGAEEKVDDEELFGAKTDDKSKPVQLDSVELPAHVPSSPSTHGWSSPAQSTSLDPCTHQGNYVPTSTVTETSAVASNHQYADQLAAKNELIGRLHADSERERADLNRERDSLHAELAMLRTHNQKLESDLEAMSQANASSDASVKETGLTIERLREDVEGREHNIEERDNAINELKRQLETEKTKSLPKPTAADLVSDIDPWYIGSLERYITMLRGEASEPQIESKIKIFKAFVEAESRIRGIDCYNTLPPTAIPEPGVSYQPEQAARSRGASNASPARHDLTIQIPQESPTDDEYVYSPGGRPMMMMPKITHPPVENVRAQPNVASSVAPTTVLTPTGQPHVASSVASTTILTPTSSVDDDDSNKTPVQSPPEEPQYQAYIPPAPIASDHVPPTHRHTMFFQNIPGMASPPGRSNSGGHDEIFFGVDKSEVQSSSRQTRSDSTTSDIPIPAPLALSPRRPVSTTPTRKDPIGILAELVPNQINSVRPNNLVEKLRTKLQDVDSQADKTKELMRTWEKSASLNRRKKDDARRKRQEEDEEHNNELFDSNEITYAELNQLENESKHKEGELKAQEGREEYQDYMGTVFSTVYHGLQAEIKVLMDLYVEAENLLRTSGSGMKSLGDPDVSTTAECLGLLKDIHKQIEERHESLVQSVADRDRRYKKTETQPLYVAGDITRMKSLEKHFENAEKQATLKAKEEKVDRMGELISLVEDIVFAAVSTEQAEIDRIVTAIKELDNGTADSELLSRAQDTIVALKLSSKALLTLFNVLEIDHNNAVLDVDIAQAKAEGADAGRLQELEGEKQRDAQKMTEEFERRVSILNQIESEVAEMVQMKRKAANGDEKDSEDTERDRRLRVALEEAKRRNGHA